MLEPLGDLPVRWQGLWERTLLERKGPGTLTNDRPAAVFWLQAPLWHADLRIPKERPDFGDITSLDACDDRQLKFIAGQEAFCGITRVEGVICTWSRLYDLNPGTSLDVAHMEFANDGFIVETGIKEAYTEHWELVDGSRPSAVLPPDGRDEKGSFFLQSGNWGVWVTPRSTPPSELNLYSDPTNQSREHLLWQASLTLSLCEYAGQDWIIRRSTLPWLESRLLGSEKKDLVCA